jgi:hypothetical protein
MDQLERFFLHLLNFCIDMFAKKYRPTFSAWAVSFTGWCSVAAPEIRSKSRRSTYSQTQMETAVAARERGLPGSFQVIQ